MKALSIRNPWANLIVRGFKDIENRTWPCNYRGELYIHVSKTFDREGHLWVKENFSFITLPSQNDFLRGGIIGKVNMIDCITESFSDWFCGPYGFVFEDAEQMPFVPMKGRLGLFDVRI